jgi:hypothetical protein
MDTPTWQSIGLTEDEWKPIDALIFTRRIIQAAQLLRKRTGLPLRDVLDVQHGRHLHLRDFCPEPFDCTIEEYYRDVYS